MENYNKLKSIISSFHFGVIEHNNHQYPIVKDPIVYKIVDPDFKTLVQDVISELLISDPAVADRSVAYVRNLLNDLSKISAETTIRAYEEFTNYLNSRFIKFTGPFITELNSPIVTTLFINSLRYEVYLRNYIIKEVSNSIQAGATYDLIFNDWYDEKRHIQPLSDSDLFKLFESEFREISTSNITNTNKRSKHIPDFEKDILNEKGKTIFKDLKKRYYNASPTEIVNMLYSLEVEGCLEGEVDKTNGTTWAKTLAKHFSRSYDRKDLEYHLTNYSLGPDPETANSNRDIELKKVKDIISRSFLI